MPHLAFVLLFMQIFLFSPLYTFIYTHKYYYSLAMKSPKDIFSNKNNDLT